MRIIICGGHLAPALAVIEELKAMPAGRQVQSEKLKVENQILFIGRRYPLEGDPAISFEYKVVAQKGIAFVNLVTGRLQRKFTRYTIFSLLKIPVGFFQALWLVAKFKPEVILSFGGYVAFPVVVAGWLQGVPIVIQEQTTGAGLANRLSAPFARKICLAWSTSAKFFPTEKIVFTGNPIRKEIFQIKKNSQFAIPNSQFPLIYITGGSLGSHAINEVVSQCLPQLLEKYVVIHQCGDAQKYKDYEQLKVKSEKLKVDLQKRYFLTKYVGPEDIGWVLNQADLVVGRAGVNTVTELAALGKPAIFIPLPYAEGEEQKINAQILVEAGTAQILPQEKLSPQTLLNFLDTFSQNIEKYRRQTPQAKKLVEIQAARNIVKVIYETR